MSDYVKNLNNYFSNLSKLNTQERNDNNLYSTVKTDGVRVSNVTFALSFLIIIVIFVIFSFFNVSFFKETNTSKNGLYKLLEILIISFGLVITAIVLFNYLLGINISANLDVESESTPEIEIVVESEMQEPPAIIQKNKEVFHLPQNIYKYKDAKAVCKAYDSELADIKEVQKAYKNGAEWCSYGWSKNQMALFPTQYKTWEKLQKTDKYKNICGRPGINGGYVSNSNKKYGVNCYGYKPNINAKNRKYMDNLTLYPSNIKTVKDEEIQYYKDNIDNIIVSPFNSSEWNE